MGTVYQNNTIGVNALLTLFLTTLGDYAVFVSVVPFFFCLLLFPVANSKHTSAIHASSLFIKLSLRIPSWWSAILTTIILGFPQPLRSIVRIIFSGHFLLRSTFWSVLL